MTTSLIQEPTTLEETHEIVRLMGGVPGEFRGERTDIMIIGEAPGENEVRQGRPFVGPAGRLLDSLMEECGIRGAYLTNVVKEFPGRDRNRKIRRPPQEMRDLWADVLRWEFAFVRPAKVLLLGETALKLVWPGLRRVGEYVGRKHEDPETGMVYWGAYHPSYFLQNQGSVISAKHMNLEKRVFEEVAGVVEDPQYEYTVLPQRTYDGALIVDLETDGTDPRTARILEATWLDPNQPRREAVLSFEPAYLPPRPTVAIMHNAMFDYPLLVRYNPEWLSVPELHDTMAMAYVLGYEDVSLKGLSHELFKTRVWTFQQRNECGPETYNAQDVHLTLRLFEHLYPQLPGAAYEIDRRLIKLLTFASLFGGYEIDHRKLEETIVETERQKQYYEQLFDQWYPGVNLASNDQLRTIFRTKDVTRQTLEELGTVEALVVLRWRQMAKRLSTYLYPVRAERRVSGLYRLTAGSDEWDESGGTTTGRLSSHDRNLQNLDPALQQCLRAPKGFTLLRADYSQIELRTMAFISDDPRMIEVLRDPNGDIHADTAAALGISRTDAKRFNFGRWYGAGAQHLSRVLNLPLDAVEELIRRQEAAYPGYAEWVKYHWERVKATGYSEAPAPYRHRRRLNVQNEDRARKQAGNHPPQSMAAYITKEAIVELGFDPAEFVFVNSIHDEIHYFVPTTKKKYYEKKVREAMLDIGNARLPTVGVNADIKLGRSWEPKE